MKPVRAGVVIAALIAFQCLSIFAAGPASAAPTCSVVSGTLTLIDDGAGLDSIDVWQDTNGSVFASVGPISGLTAPGTFCGGGVALAGLSAIHISGGTGITKVAIWMSQTPAATPPTSPDLFGGPGAAWGTVAWVIDLSSNITSFSVGPLTIAIPASVTIIDASPTDPMSVTVGDGGIDLDSDGRLDVTTVGVSLYTLSTADAIGSTMSGAGSAATGGPFAGHLLEVGGAGDDALTGGAGGDFIAGGVGRDTIDAGGGDDLASGGAGNDQIRGEEGDDRLGGGQGTDVIDGGRGRDHCNGGPGDDAVHCEIVADTGS